MIVYNKNRKLFGSLGKLPMAIDDELLYLDNNGEKVTLVNKDIYVDNGHGGIIRKSDGKAINVYVEGSQIIPNKILNLKLPKFDRKSKYLSEITIDDVDYEFADKYFNGDFESIIPTKACLCTSVWKDGKLYRNFDWNYNYDAAFAVHVTEKIDENFVHGKRFASSGTADFIPKLTTQFIDSKQYSNMYKLIPFKIVDGANENKVCVSINVVPRQRGETTNTIPEIEVKHSVQASALVRFILDNFETAEEAVEYIKNYVSVYPNKELVKIGYDIHYLIGDKNRAFIVEAIDNKLVSKEANNNFKPIITNFHVLKDVNATPIDLDNGHVYTPATVVEGKLPSSQGITSHAAGLERYNIIVNNYNDLSNFRNLVLYNNAYTEKENPWYSEFVGKYSDTYELTVDDLPEKFNEYVMPYIYEQYKTRSRDKADTWHTMHTAIYDLSTMKYSIADSSESGIFYEFNI